MAPHSGDFHRAEILALVGASGPLSRTEIAHRLELSPAAVTQLTKGLIAERRLEELSSAPSRGGRPAQMLGLTDSRARALGLKIAPDHLAFADVELDGTLRAVSVHDFDPAAPDALHRLTAALDEVDRDGLLGVGVAVPGGVHDPAEGVVNADVLTWCGLPLGRYLRAHLDVPVLVDNDVNTLAAGECLYDRGKEHRDFLIVTIGVGIGAAIITSGAVYRGAHGDAGELGHTPVDPDGPRCACGNRGCLEAIIGDRALVDRACREGVLGPEQGIVDLRTAADGGNADAQELFRAAGEILGRSVATVANVVDPETIVIFGEGVTAWQHWRPGFEPAIRAHLPSLRNRIPVEVDRWDDRSWVRGAAALVLTALFDPAGAAGVQGKQVRSRLLGFTVSPERDAR